MMAIDEVDEVSVDAAWAWPAYQVASCDGDRTDNRVAGREVGGHQQPQTPERKESMIMIILYVCIPTLALVLMDIIVDVSSSSSSSIVGNSETNTVSL